MSRFNEGMIFTNGRCMGCNKCISVCPSMGSNVSVSTDGKTRLEVSKKCIECGLCVGACSHYAREFKDDISAVLEDIDNGVQVSLLVDPIFYIAYPDKASKILGLFKKRGVHKIYDVAVGAEISMFAHAKYVKEHTGKNHMCRQYIANNCAALVNFVECLHPELIPYMIPVQSPSACTAIYVRKYLGDNSKLAYISPCIAQSTEIRSPETGNSIDYNITFTSLSKLIRRDGLDGTTAQADVYTDGLGNIVSYKGGFREGVAAFFSHEDVFTMADGLGDRNIQMRDAFVGSDEIMHPTMIIYNACEEGCLCGTGVKMKDIESSVVIETYRKVRQTSFALYNTCKSHEEYYEECKKRYKDLNMEDFGREFADRYRQPYQVPEDAINDIFISMHKDTKAKQMINCTSCGYRSCREMAVAVANGYARIQDCVRFMNDDLKYTALVDRMTGIPNTQGFRKKARELLDENPDTNYILFVGNVNKLKNVNDLYGSDMGDKVLEYIAMRLQEFTEGKGVCGRFGGGVFSVLFEDNPEVVESFMAHEFVNCRHLGVYFPVTIRYGVYKITDRAVRLGEVTNLCTYAADKATNRARNSYIEYTDSMRKEMQTETDITLKMHDAMANGEFVLFLQPQYDHHTGKIVGAEALSRWVKKDGSIVSPGVFIPVFEKNGFIKDLDRYVWENSFKLVQDWEMRNKPHVPISVNISRVSLETDEIIDVLGKLSDKYPVEKDDIYFEITESAYMSNQIKLIERVQMIKNLGFKIAMDDFGSGYSSLNSLKDIPIDVLKLDMGFLRGGTNLERGNEIVAHMVDMAKALELKIVAEGVETKEQADFLTERGCDVIQGFYYAKPMPLPEYEERLLK